jgi:hypothetical protein
MRCPVCPPVDANNPVRCFASQYVGVLIASKMVESRMFFGVFLVVHKVLVVQHHLGSTFWPPLLQFTIPFHYFSWICR